MDEKLLGPDEVEFDTGKRVSWQMAWWALVPLALAAMTQPCGNVLGRRDKSFRFYSRASPIICIADVAHFLICMALCFSFDWRFFVRNLKFELKERFSDEAGNEYTRLDAERTRLARWMFIIIGGIPCQTIKLAVMGGMFWTKLFATSFFGSIVFWEVINALSPVVRTNHRIQLPPPIWRHEYPWLVKTMDMAFLMSMGCHFYAVYTAVTTTIIVYLAIWAGSDQYFQPPLIIAGVLTLFLALSPPAMQHLRRRSILDDLPVTLSILALMAVAQIVVPRMLTPSLLDANPDVCQWGNLLTYRPDRTYTWERLASAITILSVYDALKYSTGQEIVFFIFEVVTATVFLLHLPKVFELGFLPALFRIDTTAGSYAVFTFVSTFLFSLLWYCFMFQPIGTYSPDWTEAFG